jgi:hypothetical protein
MGSWRKPVHARIAGGAALSLGFAGIPDGSPLSRPCLRLFLEAHGVLGLFDLFVKALWGYIGTVRPSDRTSFYRGLLKEQLVLQGFENGSFPYVLGKVHVTFESIIEDKMKNVPASIFDTNNVAQRPHG